MIEEIKVVKSTERYPAHDDAFLDDMNLSLSAKGMFKAIKKHQREWRVNQIDFTPHTTEEIEAINELAREGYIHVNRSH